MKLIARVAVVALIGLPGLVSRLDAQSADWPYHCAMAWTRADNMWGSYESAAKSLGEETLRLERDRSQAFITDWKHEKQRNDGRTFYGSHARSVSNRGDGTARITLKEQFGLKEVVLPPRAGTRVTGDIALIECFPPGRI